jgi:phosphoribosylanthranilate isomerase
MWVKICGNTNLEDAALAAKLGADAVGFVFVESKRQVTSAQVAAITRHLTPGVERIGVFHSHDVDEIAETASRAGLTAVQLHGGIDDKQSERLAEKFAGDVRIIQTLHWTIQPSADSSQAQQSPAAHLEQQILHIAALGIADRVLIDSKVGMAGGGTGVSFDWTAARQVFASAPSSLHLVVAGGLNPGNVARAIAQLAPWGVDISSGVEASPGRKDPALLERFIVNARGTQTP